MIRLTIYKLLSVIILKLIPLKRRLFWGAVPYRHHFWFENIVGWRIDDNRSNKSSENVLGWLTSKWYRYICTLFIVQVTPSKFLFLCQACQEKLLGITVLDFLSKNTKFEWISFFGCHNSQILYLYLFFLSRKFLGKKWFWWSV